MSDCQFEDEWDENTGNPWIAAGRARLNGVIRQYNEWQIDGWDHEVGYKLLRRIEHGKQTYGQRDGGSEWLITLERMERYTRNVLGCTDVGS